MVSRFTNILSEYTSKYYLAIGALSSSVVCPALLLAAKKKTKKAVKKALEESTSFHDVASTVWNFPLVVVDSSPVTIGKIIVGIALIVFGFFFSKYLSRKIARNVIRRFIHDKGAVATLETFSFYIFLSILTVFAFNVANVPLSVFTFIGGALAIGIGFGSQNIVNNFFSGLILMMERPLRVGDFVEVDNALGIVESIGMRSTLIRSVGNKHIIVPNSSFLEKAVVNLTHDTNKIRVAITIGFAYGSPVQLIQEILLRAAEEEPKVIKNHKPFVIFRDFGSDALTFEVHFWIRIGQLMDKDVIESNLRFRVNEYVNQAGLVIAFPQRDIHLHQSQPISVKMAS